MCNLFVPCSGPEHCFTPVLSLGKAAKETLRAVLKTLLGYDTFDPDDPVNMAAAAAAAAARSPTAPASASRPKTSSSRSAASNAASRQSNSVETLSPPLTQPLRLRLLASSQKKRRSVSPASPLFEPLPSLESRSGDQDFMRLLSFDNLTNTEEKLRKLELVSETKGPRSKGREVKRHILMSYAKGCKNEENVRTMAKNMRAEGYNVYIDEGSIGRRLDERKAEALEFSAIVVIFVSKKYHEMAVEEANYAKGLEKIGKTQGTCTLFAHLGRSLTVSRVQTQCCLRCSMRTTPRSRSLSGSAAGLGTWSRALSGIHVGRSSRPRQLRSK
jgi:TIR domain